MTAAEITQLQADAKAGREAQQELLKTRLTASVTEHVARGAIKSDQAGEAVAILMASTEAQRDRLQSFIASLPSNTLITAGEVGTGAAGSAEVELTAAEKELAADFGNTPEEVAEYKKKLEESNKE